MLKLAEKYSISQIQSPESRLLYIPPLCYRELRALISALNMLGSVSLTVLAVSSSQAPPSSYSGGLGAQLPSVLLVQIF